MVGAMGARPGQRGVKVTRFDAGGVETDAGHGEVSVSDPRVVDVLELISDRGKRVVRRVRRPHPHHVDHAPTLSVGSAVTRSA
jgi:hypothetical protein